MKKFEKTIITVFYLDDKVIPFFRLRKPGIRKVISECYNVCVCVCWNTPRATACACFMERPHGKAPVWSIIFSDFASDLDVITPSVSHSYGAFIA